MLTKSELKHRNQVIPVGGVGQPVPDRRRLRSFLKVVTQWALDNRRDFPWRRKNVPLYRLVVTEVLLQRTRAETVAKFYSTFFSLYPSWRSLARSTEKQLGETLRPIGLWRQRAPRLLGLAKAVSKRGGRLPKKEEEITALPSVGQYVGNAIQVFAAGKPAPLIDTNMARLLERYYGPRRCADIRHDKYLQILAHDIIALGDCRETNWALLDFAAKVCRNRTPVCAECPLRARCYKIAKGL